MLILFLIWFCYWFYQTIETDFEKKENFRQKLNWILQKSIHNIYTYIYHIWHMLFNNKFNKYFINEFMQKISIQNFISRLEVEFTNLIHLIWILDLHKQTLWLFYVHREMLGNIEDTYNKIWIWKMPKISYTNYTTFSLILKIKVFRRYRGKLKLNRLYKALMFYIEYFSRKSVRCFSGDKQNITRNWN